jgi:uncharacterized protein YacL
MIFDVVLLILVGIILVETSFLFVKKLRQRSLKVARGSILLDTSVLMDGRIVEVAKTGIITAELIIPRSVIREMQLLADKADHDKRARARTGLENVRELQRMESVSATVVNDGLVDGGGVDERLLELAQNYDAAIATVDFNLNKVAKVVGITVVNVNELAQMLRAVVLPGEIVEIQLVQTGQNREQAVGYLDDGTMVVVEHARQLIGQKLRVEIVRSLQTEAGRMMFGVKIGEAGGRGSSEYRANTQPKEQKGQRQSRQESVVKAAPAFHSDHNKSQAQRKHTQNRPKQAVQVRPQSSEDSMVALANRH